MWIKKFHFCLVKIGFYFFVSFENRFTPMKDRSQVSNM